MMGMVTAPTSGVLPQSSIVKFTPQIHSKKFHKHKLTKIANRLKYSYNIQLIDRLKCPKRIVYAWCSNEDKIEEDNAEKPRGRKRCPRPWCRSSNSLVNVLQKEISPLLPSSCRYVPSCSEYSMQAYRRYGVLKGTVLTAWRLCRCNPLGGSGFDPPRWFDETKPPSS